MSNEHEAYLNPDHPQVALFLMNHDGEALTDALVAALRDALRILSDDLPPETVH